MNDADTIVSSPRAVNPGRDARGRPARYDAVMDGASLVAWLASLPPETRDLAVERHFGIADSAPDAPPGEDLVGYHPSGVAAIVRAALEVPITPADVVIDLGAGLGKVVFVTKLVTGATVRGIELQPALVARARASAERLGLAVELVEGDARTADLDAGTVFFLYLPFTGPALATVLGRLHAVAKTRAIVVCALGVDLDRLAPWLTARRLESFWLSIYDSYVDGVLARPAFVGSARSDGAVAIAEETPPGR